MKISVIVTAYNREDTIKRCIESLFNQNYDDLEVVVVDDGSTDKTSDVIGSIVWPNDIKHVIVRQDNAGVAAARNAGLKAATGDYVTYLDSDDYMEPDSVRQMAEEVIKGDLDILVYDAYSVNLDGTKEYFSAYHDGRSNVYEGIIGAAEYLFSNACPWDRLMKKSLFKDTFGSKDPFPVGLWYEDLATMPLLIISAKKIAYVKRPFVNYVQSKGSIMRGRRFNPHFDDVFSVCDRLYKSLDFKYHTECEYLMFEHLLVTGGKRYLNCRKKDRVERVADYMKEHYPDWKKNVYIKTEPAKKKKLAELIYNKKYYLLKLLGK